jgi:hypothetical protein
MAIARDRECSVTLTWEHERTAVGALASQLAEVECHLHNSSFATPSGGPSASLSLWVRRCCHRHPPHLGDRCPEHMVAFLCCSWSVVHPLRLLRATRCSSLQRYALADHVLINATSSFLLSWHRMDIVVLSWILDTLIVEL